MSKSMFGWDSRNAVSNDIGFGVNMAKAIASTVIKEEGSLELGERMASGARGATLILLWCCCTRGGKLGGNWGMYLETWCCAGGNPVLR